MKDHFPATMNGKLNYVLDITGSHTPDEKKSFLICLL